MEDLRSVVQLTLRNSIEINFYNKAAPNRKMDYVGIIIRLERNRQGHSLSHEIVVA